jgi:hypothetical protein
VVQIAENQHVARPTVNAAYLDAVISGLSTAVKNGSMTRSQADSTYSLERHAVAAGHYPQLESLAAGRSLPGTPPAGGSGIQPMGTPPSGDLGAGTPPSGAFPGTSGSPCLGSPDSGQ